MMEKIISTKVNKLPTSKKGLIVGIFAGLCGDKAGKMKYVQIDGIDLGGFENKCTGEDSEMYLNCLIDTISIVSAKGTEEEINLCDSNSSSVASIFNIKVKGILSRVDVLSSWSDDFVNESDVEK